MLLSKIFLLNENPWDDVAEGPRSIHLTALLCMPNAILSPAKLSPSKISYTTQFSHSFPIFLSDLEGSSPQIKHRWSNPTLTYMTTLYPLPASSTTRLMWNFCTLYSTFPTKEGEIPDHITTQTCKPFPDSHLSLRERDASHLTLPAASW